MNTSPLGFIEFFVVLLFAAGWLVLECVTRRLDRQREARAPRPSSDVQSRAE